VYNEIDKREQCNTNENNRYDLFNFSSNPVVFQYEQSKNVRANDIPNRKKNGIKEVIGVELALNICKYHVDNRK
jgi:hypothetical protein